MEVGHHHHHRQHRRCDETTWGCCTDGVTARQDADDRCQMGGCASTRWGCCADAVTAKRGPHDRCGADECPRNDWRGQYLLDTNTLQLPGCDIDPNVPIDAGPDSRILRDACSRKGERLVERYANLPRPSLGCARAADVPMPPSVFNPFDQARNRDSVWSSTSDPFTSATSF